MNMTASSYADITSPAMIPEELQKVDHIKHIAVRSTNHDQVGEVAVDHG